MFTGFVSNVDVDSGGTLGLEVEGVVIWYPTKKDLNS